MFANILQGCCVLPPHLLLHPDPKPSLVPRCSTFFILQGSKQVEFTSSCPSELVLGFTISEGQWDKVHTRGTLSSCLCQLVPEENSKKIMFIFFWLAKFVITELIPNGANESSFITSLTTCSVNRKTLMTESWNMPMVLKRFRPVPTF